MNLQQKVMNAFIGKVVRKDLAFLVKGACLFLPTCWNTCWGSIAPVMMKKSSTKVWKR
ncbi:hypothetical protein NNC58_10490 [Prevotella copri]|uniref:Uncharacterized protein n=1 Tax=Segatella copri TaxID=165179 RepID=A0AAW5IM39_9BACT|nr:hypothetical protein [Segatella copri]MCP9535039.1 hypothetical protein [Segatella copri]MCP9538096.1 hypothetical protein [Segatella copri]MCP9540985.1 hypothetical protein [Segatella copri]MCP9559255.1 hypothetical protein [Segatella copri]MCP9562045.1 hypothetical protein [Segatella copri]